MKTNSPKALIITCNDSYDYGTRTYYVEHVLKGKGYSVEFLISDFDHRSKKRYKIGHEGMVHYIHVPAYKRNLSIGRIISHIRFGQKVKHFIMVGDYDLIYHCAPPNYTIKQISKCKDEKQFKLITEVGDMWPESIPIGDSLKKVFEVPFKIWRGLRDKYLDNSDTIIAECDLFRDAIRRNTGLSQVQTLYFCKKFTGESRTISYEPGDPISLCYLGSINNIIDIDIIVKIISEIAKRTMITMHIIGDGEKRHELIDRAEKAGAKVEFYGIVFDETKKRKVFNECHFALNIMKPEVFVGMTMKSLDYLSAGLPIINNIGADVWKMVERDGIGFNISEKSIPEIVNEILSMTSEQYHDICKSVKEVHKKHFSIECVTKTISSLI